MAVVLTHLYASALFVISTSVVYSARAPPYIHPCNTTNPQCLTKATREALPGFVKGIPELNIPSLDPFDIDELALDLPGSLNFTLYKGKATGLKNCVVNEVTAEVGIYQQLDFNCNLTMRGKYRAQGRVLLFQIHGNGDARIKITNMHMVLRHKTKLMTDGLGVHHVVSAGYSYTIDYQGPVHFQLTNLFNNSPELSQTVVTFLNENWRLVVKEFGKPIVEHFLALADKTINSFFLQVPYEEIIHVPYGVSTL